jgi:hypothetical protein
MHGKYNSVYEQSSPEVYDKWALDEECPYDDAVAQHSSACQSVYQVLHSIMFGWFYGIYCSSNFF